MISKCDESSSDANVEVAAVDFVILGNTVFEPVPFAGDPRRFDRKWKRDSFAGIRWRETLCMVEKDIF